MELKRNIVDVINKWFNAGSNDSDYFKHLVIVGNSKVGKTTTIKNYFEFKNINYFYVNLSNHTDIHKYVISLNIEKVFEFIKYNTNEIMNHPIFFDDAHSCIDIFKFVCEVGKKHPHVKIIISINSLYSKEFLAFLYSLNHFNVVELLPLSFEEFVNNVNYSLNKKSTINNEIVNLLKEANFKNINLIYNDYLKDLYYKYLIVGGMPKFVDHYIENIVTDNTYELDKNPMSLTTLEHFYKDEINHLFNRNESKKAISILNSIHRQMNESYKKFCLNKINIENRNNDNNKFRDFKNAFNKLQSSRMVDFVYCLKELSKPYEQFINESKFKIYYQDISFYSSRYSMRLYDIVFRTESWKMIEKGVEENFIFNEIKFHCVKQNFLHQEIYTFNKNNSYENVDLTFILNLKNLKPLLINTKYATLNISNDILNNYNLINCDGIVLNISDDVINIPPYLIGYFIKYVIGSDSKTIYEKYKLKF